MQTFQFLVKFDRHRGVLFDNDENKHKVHLAHYEGMSHRMSVCASHMEIDVDLISFLPTVFIRGVLLHTIAPPLCNIALAIFQISPC